MSKKSKIIFGAVAVALVAIVVSICFIFFGNKSIKHIPNSLEVQVVEGEYCLVAEYNAEYEYEFKLEKFIDDEYMTIQTINSKTNIINLSECDFNIDYGVPCRFSVRYTNEDGKGKSEFGESVVWTPLEELPEIDYSAVIFEDCVLSWEIIPQADSYSVIVVDTSLQKQTILCQDETCDLNNLAVGKYTAYIVANNADFSAVSDMGEGKQIVVERKNLITNAKLVDSDTLVLNCSEQAERFEVRVDENLVGYLSEAVVEDGQYTFSDCKVLFADVDFENVQIEIRSLKSGYVLESDFVSVLVEF